VLDAGGRDLDNYLFPVIQRLVATRFVAVFGRKVHGASTLAIGRAVPVEEAVPPQFTMRLTGSYTEQRWKHLLRERLRRAAVAPAPDGPLAADIAITTTPSPAAVTHTASAKDATLPARQPPSTRRCTTVCW
jgi:hypothetical protein